MTPASLAEQLDLYGKLTPFEDRKHAYVHAAKLIREFLVPEHETLLEGRAHLTAELVRMTQNACGACRVLFTDPIPRYLAHDANWALIALDKYGDPEQRDKTTSLVYTREDVAKALQ